MKYKKLGEECYIVMGQSPESKTYNSKKEGTPFLQGRKTFGRIYPYIDTWTTHPIRIGKKGSVLFSVRAPVGDVNIATEDICIGRGLASISMKNKHNLYLYYLLLNNRESIKNMSTGTVFESINRSELENLILKFHEEEEQCKVEKLLGCIDKKIELNSKMNNNLQDISKQLYKRWFIDFEFPNKDGKPYKSSGGKMIDSELGEIPKNWNVKTIDDMNLEISDGNYSNKYPKKSEFVDNGIPFIRGTDFIGTTISRTGLMFISEKKHSELKKGHLKENDILITTRGEIGRIAYVPKKYIDANINAQLIRINGKTEFPKSFLGNFLQSYKTQQDISSLTTGSALQQLPVGKFKKIKIILPQDNGIIQNFNELTKCYYEKIDELENENEILIQLRDTLLPKLMNGEINLDNIEI